MSYEIILCIKNTLRVSNIPLAYILLDMGEKLMSLQWGKTEVHFTFFNKKIIIEHFFHFQSRFSYIFFSQPISHWKNFCHCSFLTFVSTWWVVIKWCHIDWWIFCWFVSRSPVNVHSSRKSEIVMCRMLAYYAQCSKITSPK